MPPSAPPDPALLKEAADWAMTLRYGTPTPAERQAFDRWCRLSPAHAAAWDRAQAVFDTFSQLPAGIGKEALQTLQRDRGRSARRRSLRLLGVLAAAPVGWLAWRHLPWWEWTADVATATGERRSLELPDGSRLVLNTASAVDIAFGAAERRVRLLAGELLVTTHADPAPIARPFLVDTPLGVVRALGTRFSVRQLDQDSCRVAVFEHAVAIQPPGEPARILRAGEQADFGRAGVKPSVPVDSSPTLWEQGMLLARNMRLAEVIAEMARHRPGVLRCAPEVAELRVSGAVSLADTDAGLRLLAGSLPLRIERATRYWVTVLPLR